MYGDADVDDLTLLALSFGDTGDDAYWGTGDYNGDGLVDEIDLDLMRLNWSGTPASLNAALQSVRLVPEPGTAVILGLGLLLLPRRRGRQVAHAPCSATHVVVAYVMFAMWCSQHADGSSNH